MYEESSKGYESHFRFEEGHRIRLETDFETTQNIVKECSNTKTMRS